MTILTFMELDKNHEGRKGIKSAINNPRVKESLKYAFTYIFSIFNLLTIAVGVAARTQ